MQVNYSRVETLRFKEFEIRSQATSKCPLSASDDHGVEEHVTFVDEIGFERKPRKLGAANVDVMRRLPLELPNSLKIKAPLEARVACRKRLSAFVKRRSFRLSARPVRSRRP